MKKILFALALCLSLAAIAAPVDAGNITVIVHHGTPSPVSYGPLHPRVETVVVARGTVATICPKLDGAGLVNGQRCDPLGVAVLSRGERLRSVGYVWVRRHRWWLLHVTAWNGSPNEAWVYGPNLWAGWWAFGR